MEPRDIEMIEEKMAVYGWSVKCVIEMIDVFNRMLDVEITSIIEGSSDETPTGLIQYAEERENDGH